jgi:pyruvate,water dikinase
MRNRFCITDEQALEIAKSVVAIEKYYSEKKGHWCPMDVEWAVDGLSKQLFIVQARPETIHSRKATDRVVEYKLQPPKAAKPRSIITTGIAIGDRACSTGKVRILFSLDGRGGGTDGKDFQQGDVLVTDMTDPDWEPIMKKASAIITNKGGRTCHAAIVAREMGVPAIVGCGNATDLLENGMEVTASCCEGDTGIIYSGIIPFHKEETLLADMPETKTPIMLNVASARTWPSSSLACRMRRGTGARRVHHQQLHPGASARAAAAQGTRRCGPQRQDQLPDQRLRGRGDLLREAPELRHRQDRQLPSTPTR